MSSFPLDQIIQGNCIEVLEAFPPASVDMIFADPPYNLQLKQELYRPNLSRVNGVEDGWDKFETFSEYDCFTRKWLEACRRVLKETGTLWVIGSYHNIFRVGTIMQDLGFWLLNDVVWIKTNPMPNFRGVRFTNAHETLIWAKKCEEARYTFNYQAMKELNQGKQMRSDWWLLPLTPNPERLKAKGKKAHSTQKPEALLYRVILAATNPGDVVLDPFFGTGTTGAVAKKLHRHWIGIEKESNNIEIAQARIDAIEPEAFTKEVFHLPARRNQPRIALSILVENGLLKPGQVLFFKKQKEQAARIKPNGLLVLGEHEGSIHQLGRMLSAGGPCNGWEHWYYQDQAGELKPLDTLRQQYRTQITNGQDKS